MVVAAVVCSNGGCIRSILFWTLMYIIMQNVGTSNCERRVVTSFFVPKTFQIIIMDRSKPKDNNATGRNWTNDELKLFIAINYVRHSIGCQSLPDDRPKQRSAQQSKFVGVRPNPISNCMWPKTTYNYSHSGRGGVNDRGAWAVTAVVSVRMCLHLCLMHAPRSEFSVIFFRLLVGFDSCTRRR